MKQKQLFILILLFCAIQLNAQTSKEQLTTNINTWYKNNPEGYTIQIDGHDAKAFITRHNPERDIEKNDLIEVSYKGMSITLKFNKPLDEITTSKDSLQKHFSYVSLNNIYHNISSTGWNIYPQTPQSALGGKGLCFTSEGDSISFTIDWSIFTVMGYKDTKKCNNERLIEDDSISEECYVSETNNIKLKIIVSNLRL